MSNPTNDNFKKPWLSEAEIPISAALEGMMIVSKAKLAEIFGVTPTTIGRWVKQGAPVVAAPDGGETRSQWRFDAGAVMAWRLKQVAREKNEADAKVLADAKRREKEAKASLKELELGQRQGLLVHVDDVVVVHNEQLAIYKSGLMSMPNRLNHQLAETTTPEDCERIIREDVEKIVSVFNVDAAVEFAVEAGKSAFQPKRKKRR